ncbi:MAG: methionine--tRNA ligase [Acidobacteria bacterium]|nr:MAG: methionine--tRNA ligase [Acidobacteriota bacterium]
MSYADNRPKFYLTTPIYYANARPHVGSAYTTLVADTIARFKRMHGYDVAFLTGTDEHGENIARAAAKAGVTPREHVDRYSAVFRNLWNELGISYTHFIRTTSPEHLRAVRRLLLRARDAGYIYKGFYQGRYCVYDNLYVSDSTDPVDCPLCGRPAEVVSEENYFFKLSAFQEKLLKLYQEQPDFIRPAFRRNEVQRFVEAGLRDISLSRKTVKWGLPWPDDPEQVVYVWYDALTSYLSGIGYGDDELQWERYWPAQLHLIGKEIIRFHCVYWPAFLLAAQEPLPKAVFAHGWLLFEQQKMSKSKGNVAYAEPIARTIGVDALRYYLLRDVPFGQDGNFSHEALLTRYNSDLANGLGNLASRTLTMIGRYCEGQVPAAHSAAIGDAEKSLAAAVTEAARGSAAQYEELSFSRALELIWAAIAEVDGYITAEKPWSLAENPAERARLETVLYYAAESLRILVMLAHPVLPEATAKIWRQLGQFGALGEARIDQLAWGALRPGALIGEPAAVFPRVEKTETLEKIAAMEQEIVNPQGTPTATTPAAAPAAQPGAAAAANARISIDDFTKVEMRVGQVKSAERVAGADKLLKVMVDVGEEVRQIVAGIATAYQPEQLVGRKVVVVVNLQPRKLRGVESNGMIVAASVGSEGKPVLAGFLEDVPVGSRLK